MQSIIEEWKDIPSFEGSFQVSNLGQVKSLDRLIYYKSRGKDRTRITKGKMLVVNANGEICLPFNNNQDSRFYVDQLVIQCFTDIDCDEWKIIVHKDEDLRNNAISNLSVIDPFADDSEEWKDIPSFEGYYKVSSKGRILKCPKGRITRRGLEQLQRCQLLEGNSVSLYDMTLCKYNYDDRNRIVAKTFIQQDLTNYKVVHIDGDKMNNSVDNLKLVPTNAGYYVPDAIDEEWRPVVGYEGLYDVSDHGNVRSLDRYVDSKANDGNIIKKFYPGQMKMQGDVNGYKTVTISGTTFLVHRLVAEAFIPNPENKPEVNHKDRNHANNHVSNLEWVTKLENMKHARENGFDPSLSRKGKHNSDKWYEAIKHANYSMNDIIIENLRNGQLKYSKQCRCIETGQKFRSFAEAGRQMHIDPTAISESIKQNRKAKGYTFELITD